MNEGARLDVRVLGTVEVLRGTTPVELGTPRQRSLFSRLLLDSGRVVPLDRLIDDLWAGGPPAAATATLQAYVSNLRRSLEPDRPPRTAARVLVTRPPGYVVETSCIDLDRDRFVEHVECGRRALDEGRPTEAVQRFDDALALWRGVPFADLDPELDDVARPERVRLTEIHASVVEDRLGVLVDLGRHRHVLGDLERLVAEHPYRERAWELLILARYRSGQQVDALRAFQDARRALVEHVGVEPGAQLVDLERRVVAQDPSLDPPARAEPVTARDASGDDDADDHSDDDASIEPTHRVLVGRDAELASITAAIDRLPAGVGGVVLVVGEAGIGKTALVDAALGALAADQAHVAWGRAVEGDFAPGYWPWTQALGQLVDSAEPQVVAAGGPELRSVVPHLPPDGPDDGLDTGFDDGPAATRFAAQRAVGRFLGHLARSRPVIIVLDDLHWADGSSLRLLSALANDLVRSGVLVLGTYRPAEGIANPALTDMLAAVVRAGGRRIELGGLGRLDVAAHFEQIGRPIDARTADEVQRRTGGNPFFLTELGRAAMSRPDVGLGGILGEVPHGVSDIVRQRLGRLPDPTVRLLESAAVAGRTSELDVLADATGHDVEDALDLLEPAIAGSVVELDPDRPGNLRFTHDLVRDAVYSAVATGSRVRAHRRIADSLSARTTDDRDADRIAQHYWASLPLGTAPDAFRWAGRAARRASATGADDEAVVSWELALTAHEVVHPDDLLGRYDLLVELARARSRAWDVLGATESIHAAIDLAIRLDDPVRVVDVASVPSEISLWDWNLPGDPPLQLVEALEHAIARLEHDGPADADHGPRLARAWGALGVALRYLDTERSISASDRGVEIATTVGDPHLLARVIANAYQARWSRNRADEELMLADRLVAVARAGALGPDIEAIGAMFRMMNLHQLGRIDELSTDIVLARALRQRVRWPAVAAQLDYTCGTWAAMSGHRDDARDLVERAWRTRFQDSTMFGGEWTYALARTGIGDLSPDEHLQLGRRLAAAAGHEPSDLVRPTAAVLLMRGGAIDEARALADGGPRVVESWVHDFSLVQWAELVVGLGLPGAEALYDELLPYADGFAVAGTNVTGWGSMHLTLGRLAHAAGHRDRAGQHLRHALAVHRRHGFDALAARTEELLARIIDDPDQQLPDVAVTAR